MRKTVSMRTLAGIAALALAVPAAGYAQGADPSDVAAAAPTQEASASAMGAPQLASLLAPVALYPDPLLTEILAASTYPLEVVEANRWLSEPGNAGLQGDQLMAALQQKDWDPSVKSLVPFPQILKMMDDQLDWTQQLGNAFLAQQGDVMDTVQTLRRQAQQAGGLTSTPQQTVSTQDNAVEIEPANPQQVAVPAYDPNVVYGGWPYPDAPPMAVAPYYPGYDDVAFDDGWYFGPPVFINAGIWFWGGCDWHHHDLYVDRNRFGRFNPGRPFVGSNTWQHDPGHRRGVNYQSAALQQRYQPNRVAAVNAGQGFANRTLPQHFGTPPTISRPPVAAVQPQAVPHPVQAQPGRSVAAPVVRAPVAMPHPVAPGPSSTPFHSAVATPHPVMPAGYQGFYHQSVAPPRSVAPGGYQMPYHPVAPAQYRAPPAYRAPMPVDRSYTSARSYAPPMPARFSSSSSSPHFSAPSGGSHASSGSSGGSFHGSHR